MPAHSSTTFHATLPTPLPLLLSSPFSFCFLQSFAVLQLLLALALVHQLSQWFHRCRHGARYIAVYRRQQIRICHLRALLLCQLQRLLLLRFPCLRGQHLPVMPLVHRAAYASSSQHTAQCPSRRQPPTTVRRNPHLTPRTDIRRIAPRVHALTEALECVLKHSVACGIHTRARLVLVPAHRLPPSSARTFPSARERCAFTVPSLNPVARAISP